MLRSVKPESAAQRSTIEVSVARLASSLRRVFQLLSRILLLVPLLAFPVPGCSKLETPREASGLAIEGLIQADPKTERRKLTVDLGAGVKMDMVFLPAGEFLMGASEGDNDACEEEKPQHHVRITKPFCIAQYLLTHEQWVAVMGEGSTSYTKAPKDPEDRITRESSRAFLTRLNAKISIKGWRFALPTEAQWEYACRAGSTTRYCFGDDSARLGEYAWYRDNSRRDGKWTTHPAGEKKPNAWGLYDMHGSVGEYCQDIFDPDYYRMSPDTDPRGPTAGFNLVLRGGDICASAAECRSSFRRDDFFAVKAAVQGMRVCLVESQ